MDDKWLAELRREVRYHRDRRDLYRAKVYGPRPTSVRRLRELEQAYELAESRLRRLERKTVPDRMGTRRPSLRGRK
jgi:hypothetical protein